MSLTKTRILHSGRFTNPFISMVSRRYFTTDRFNEDSIALLSSEDDEGNLGFSSRKLFDLFLFVFTASSAFQYVEME